MTFTERTANLLHAYRFLPGPVAQLVKDLAIEVDSLRARVAALSLEIEKCKSGPV